MAPLEVPTGVRHKSLFEGSPRSNQLGPHGREGVLVNKQGLKLAAYWWPAHTKATGIVHVIHGDWASCQRSSALSSHLCVLAWHDVTGPLSSVPLQGMGLTCRMSF